MAAPAGSAAPSRRWRRSVPPAVAPRPGSSRTVMTCGSPGRGVTAVRYAISGQAHFEFLLRGRQLQRLPGLAHGAAVDEDVRARGLDLHRDLAEDRLERKPHVATRTRGDRELVRGGLVAVAGRDDRQRHVRPHLERQRRATAERPADADVRAGGLRAHDQRAVRQAEPDRAEGLRLFATTCRSVTQFLNPAWRNSIRCVPASSSSFAGVVRPPARRRAPARPPVRSAPSRGPRRAGASPRTPVGGRGRRRRSARSRPGDAAR